MIWICIYLVIGVGFYWLAQEEPTKPTPKYQELFLFVVLLFGWALIVPYSLYLAYKELKKENNQ